ncbi:MAG: hypothetical protein HRT53_18575 [Colwellia sp.]|nr:hypothetical protein [Colwellia sp.]
MKNVNKTLLALSLTIASGLTIADTRAQYNHGNHNDVGHNFAAGSTMTASCGAGVSLSACTAFGNIILQGAVDSQCQSMISWVGPGQAAPYNLSYYHEVRSGSYSIQSVSSSGGVWQVDVNYNCRALRHQGARLEK